MMFVQTMPIIYSLIFALSVGSVVFVWRYAALRKRALSLLYSLPSVMVVGPKLSGKSALIELITNQSASTHIFRNDLKLSKLKSGKQIIQFIELPYQPDEKTVADMKKLNLKRILYVFDASESAESMEKQLEYANEINKMFEGVQLTPVANKVHDSKKEKIEKLRTEKLNGKFERIYQIPDFTEPERKAENFLQLRKELEDITHLIDGMATEITPESEIKYPSSSS